MTDEITAQEKAIDQALEYAEVGEWQGAIAWAQVAQAIIMNNQQAILNHLGVTAALWMSNPTPEAFGDFEQAVGFYREINN